MDTVNRAVEIHDFADSAESSCLGAVCLGMVASILGGMDAMSVTVRHRIHVSETPHLAAVLGRNALPGEPRARTLVRLAERADEMFAAQQDFLVFHPDRGPIDTAGSALS